MCSILAILDPAGDPDGRLRARALRLSALQRHRGPDWSGLHSAPTAVLAHERLAIVDIMHGAQPLTEAGGTAALAVNGEIYNHRELKAGLARPFAFTTASDCEVILALYRERGTDFLADLNGIYAFVLHDPDFGGGTGRTLVARDPVGVVPLYMGWDDEGRLHIASEMKALVPVCAAVAEFPPGHLLDTAVSAEPVEWVERPWAAYAAVAGAPGGAAEVRAGLEAAVHRQLMSDVPYGLLLSGGLDSSILAAVAQRFATRPLHSFSIGLEGSPDLAVAAEVAEHVGTAHHGFTFTLGEGIDALRDAIHHLETYDVTTIRAGTPMMLLARRIKAMGIKMVLSGEGADEIFGGYLYFHRAPDAEAFHLETVRKVSRLHLYDCLRANKAMAAWGVEARVPFLDLDFLETAMRIDPAVKMIGADGVEKRVLREAFADLLPDVVLHRQKEQFSDGVGYGWIDGLRDHAAERVSEGAMALAGHRFPHNTPETREAYLYRSIFEELFPLPSAAACVPGGATVACSTPEALAWDDSFRTLADPSGRAVRGVHVDAW